MSSDPTPSPTPGPPPETDPYGNGTLVPSDHWGKGCPADCEVHAELNEEGILECHVGSHAPTDGFIEPEWDGDSFTWTYADD